MVRAKCAHYFMGAFANLLLKRSRSCQDSQWITPSAKDWLKRSQGSTSVLTPSFGALLVAEKVERTLGNMDDEFWSHFYRVLGYHFATEGNSAEADEARRKSLELTEKMLADPRHEGKRKELLYVAAAMKHFLRQDDDTKKLLNEAGALRYANKALEGEQDKGYDAYLSKLIKEYLEMLKKGEGPAKMKVNADH